MATHLDDEEDLERLKTWWRENWIALVGGLVIGFGAIGGWEGYKSWKQGRAESASQLYEELRKDLAERKTDEARKLVDTLVADYAGTPYAAVASLALAQNAVEQQQFAEAQTRLRWVVDHADDAAVVQLARLRLARALYAEAKHDEALNALQGEAGPFAALYEELRGDVQLAKGDRAAARSAYERALAASEADAGTRPLLEQKRDDLAGGTAS